MSNANPQYVFQKGIKDFGSNGQEAMKQEVYKNLLGMEAVTMVEPGELEKKL